MKPKINISTTITVRKKSPNLSFYQKSIFPNKIKNWITCANLYLHNLPKLTVSKALTKKININQNINIAIVGTKNSQKLNWQFRKKNHPTNVLSFDVLMPEINLLQGDLIICMPIVIKEAQRFNINIEARFVHMLIHGYLHISGLDHQTEKERLFMEKLEIAIMQELGFENPYFETL